MFHVRHAEISPFDFHGLQITDLTPLDFTAASVAQITVAPGVAHATARSSRSDKLYVCTKGWVEFAVVNIPVTLKMGDLLVIPKNTWFSYRNATGNEARLLLVHVPGFDLDAEEFRDQ